MGKISKGILGGISGTVGNVVGGSWKGIDYLRSKAASVANPRTEGQTNQRNKFSAVTVFASLILGSVIQVFWNGLKAKMSGFNVFVQSNIVAVTNAGTILFDNLKLSLGSLLGQVVNTLSANAGTDVVTISWIDNGGTGNALATDQANIVMYNETKNTFMISIGELTRADETSGFIFNGIEQNDIVHVYLWFNEAGNVKKASESTYKLLVW